MRSGSGTRACSAPAPHSLERTRRTGRSWASPPAPAADHGSPEEGRMPHDTLNGIGHALAAPVRNRYFYGKLLDVHHLQLEQRYFVEKLRLLNRLSLGSGVLAGLHVQVRGDAVVIGPGVAIDGCGRVIVVTNPYVIYELLAIRVYRYGLIF